MQYTVQPPHHCIKVEAYTYGWVGLHAGWADGVSRNSLSTQRTYLYVRGIIIVIITNNNNKNKLFLSFLEDPIFAQHPMNGQQDFRQSRRLLCCITPPPPYPSSQKIEPPQNCSRINNIDKMPFGSHSLSLRDNYSNFPLIKKEIEKMYHLLAGRIGRRFPWRTARQPPHWDIPAKIKENKKNFDINFFFPGFNSIPQRNLFSILAATTVANNCSQKVSTYMK